MLGLSTRGALRTFSAARMEAPISSVPDACGNALVAAPDGPRIDWRGKDVPRHVFSPRVAVMRNPGDMDRDELGRAIARLEYELTARERALATDMAHVAMLRDTYRRRRERLREMKTELASRRTTRNGLG